MDLRWQPQYLLHFCRPLKIELVSIYAIFLGFSAPTKRQPPPMNDQPNLRGPINVCQNHSEKNVRSAIWYTVLNGILTFGATSVKFIWSTSNVTKVYGSGTVVSKFGIFTCWCNTHTANMSMSSIKRPNRTLPKKVMYLSRIERSLASGITADINESCMVRGGSSSIVLGSYCVKYSRLFGSTDQFSWMPSFFTISALTARINQFRIIYELYVKDQHLFTHTVIHSSCSCNIFFVYDTATESILHPEIK